MRLEGSNLGWRYEGGPWLFRGFNMTLEPGEIVGLTGPSGSGKTSLGRLLAGYTAPIEGKVSVEVSNSGMNTNRQEHGRGDVARSRGSNNQFRGIGYDPVQLILQHPEKAVNPRWRMEKILTEGWVPNGELLESLGIREEWRTRYPNELSGGELQRCCIARALGPETKFLIADEMTTMLDAVTQAQIWHSVLEIARIRHLGVLVISHDFSLVGRICQRTINIG